MKPKVIKQPKEVIDYGGTMAAKKITMADTQTYKLSDYNELPEWLKRSWSSFKRAIIQAEFKQDLADAQKQLAVDDKLLLHWRMYLQQQHQIGQDQSLALVELLTNPKATDEKLLNKLAPPLKFINHGLKEIRPASDPRGLYQESDQLDIVSDKYHGERLSRSKEMNYLAFDSSVTMAEMIDFIERHFDEVKPWQNQSGLAFETERSLKARVTQVSQNELVDERMRELRGQGVRPKDIPAYIMAEFGEDLLPDEVSKRLNQLKRRKNRQ